MIAGSMTSWTITYEVAMIFPLFISLFVFVVQTVATDDTTTDYVHQLEQKISDLESHSQASEQKQAAVLASILSQLQSQTQEIDQLKNELDNITASNCSSVSSPGRELVVFEARTSHDILHTSRIHFQQVTRNIGGGFSSSTGVFTAPFSGTYQIWYSVTIAQTHKDTDTILKVTGGAGASVNGSYVNLYRAFKILQGIVALSLSKDEKVYLTLDPPVKVKAKSTFGGVLLGDQ